MLAIISIAPGALNSLTGWGALSAAVLIFLLFIFICAVAVRFYRKVDQGTALIINKLKSTPDVTFTGGIVIPILYKAEEMDISVKAMEVNRTGANGLICADNIRADIRVSFYVRVNKTQEDVLKVAQTVGCKRASTKDTLEELFQAKFSEALKTVGKQMEFTTLFTEREAFKERIIRVIGADLNGYRLEDVAIDYLEQTPLASLDPYNILDAQGIRKITDLTSREAISTNEFNRNRETVIKKQDVAAKEKILELERQQAEAEARQRREIDSVQAREQAEATKIKAEEHLKAELANIQTEEELRIAEENKERQAQVAAKAKEKAVQVETERVNRDRELEAVERERQVALRSIEKEKEVEIQKKTIADVIRERVKVERTVAEEQERIKDTVEFAGAERRKKVEVTKAEQEAEQALVRETKAAEAKELAAHSLYKQRVTMADAVKAEAEREAEAVRIRADKEAEAKKILAEGTIAEESATGLATVKVREADANAIELQGKAEASALLVKAEAEAKGIDQKAAAMKKLDAVGKDHEEFKLRLAKDERVQLAAIDVDRQIAEAQAKVLAEAMKTAKIDIVGGDGQFLEKFFRSISLAKSVDGLVDRSAEARKLVAGEEDNLVSRLSEAIAATGLKGDDLKDLSVAALLSRLAASGKSETIVEEVKKIIDNKNTTTAP